MSYIKKNTLSIITALSALILAVGSLTFFRSRCGADMHCHSANTVISAVAAALVILAVIGLFLKGKAKAVLSFITAGAALTEALVPGVIMSLCMMSTMSCRSVMRPWTLLLSAVIMVAAVINGIIAWKKG